MDSGCNTFALVEAGAIVLTVRAEGLPCPSHYPTVHVPVFAILYTVFINDSPTHEVVFAVIDFQWPTIKITQVMPSGMDGFATEFTRPVTDG